MSYRTTYPGDWANKKVLEDLSRRLDGWVKLIRRSLAEFAQLTTNVSRNKEAAKEESSLFDWVVGILVAIQLVGAVWVFFDVNGSLAQVDERMKAEMRVSEPVGECSPRQVST